MWHEWKWIVLFNVFIIVPFSLKLYIYVLLRNKIYDKYLRIANLFHLRLPLRAARATATTAAFADADYFNRAIFVYWLSRFRFGAFHTIDTVFTSFVRQRVLFNNSFVWTTSPIVVCWYNFISSISWALASYFTFLVICRFTYVIYGHTEINLSVVFLFVRFVSLFIVRTTARPTADDFVMAHCARRVDLDARRVFLRLFWVTYARVEIMKIRRRCALVVVKLRNWKVIYIFFLCQNIKYNNLWSGWLLNEDKETKSCF